MRKTKVVLVLSLFIFGCSTALQKRVPSERVDSGAVKENAPDDIIEDGMKLSEVHFFPTETYKKMEAVLSDKSKDVKTRISELPAIFCNGTTPKVSPSYIVETILPKSPRGLSIDVANILRRKIIEKNKEYVYNRMLDAASEPIYSILSKHEKYDYDYENYQDRSSPAKFNPRFSSYKKYILDASDGKANWNGSNFDKPNETLVFTMPKNDVNGLKEIYSSIEYQPNSQGIVVVKVTDPAFVPADFVGIMIPDKRKILLIPRGFEVVKASWAVDSYHDLVGPKIELGVAKEVPENFYTFSEYGWKLTGIENKDPHYPAQLSYFDDLGFLKSHFTFTLSKEVAMKLAEKEDGEGTDYYKLDTLGYDLDPDNGGYRFSPSLAIKNRDKLWTEFLKSSLIIQEEPSEGGSKFKLTLDMSNFCVYGTPLSSLQSQ